MYVGRIIGGTVGHTYVEDLTRTISRLDSPSRPGMMLDLNESLKHVNHSPTGFCWGYCGSGPHQAAFAILFDYLKDKRRVLKMYSEFAHRVIARLDMDKDFTLGDREIEDFITAFEIERMKEN